MYTQNYILLLMLEQINGVRVVGEAGSSGEVLALYRERKADVVILDFQLPDASGLKWLENSCDEILMLKY